MIFSLVPISLQDKVKKPLILIVFVLLLAFFEMLGITRPIIQAGQTSLTPLLQFNVRLVGSFYQFFEEAKGWRSTARRVRDLEIKLAQTSAQLGELQQLRQENQQLRELLQTVGPASSEVLITRPILSIAQPAVGLPAAAEDELKVQPGLAVLVEETLVGVVSRVQNNVAYVGLLWQKDSPFVLAQTETGVNGLLAGDGRRVLLTEIPVDEQVVVGDRVTTTGQEGIAQGLFVGEVRSIQSGDTSAVKTAVIEQYVSFYESGLVEIKL